jgi:hypothetical protein
MSSEKDFGYRLETKASEAQIKHREALYRLFRERPLPDDQLLINLGLYMRSSPLAKILFLNELYELVLDLPGVIMEFGTWWGQNLVVFENLRAIYEPFNQNRRIIGFDTFKGYPSISDKDRPSETIKVGGYKVTENYRAYLEELIDYHEKENVLANVKKHQVVEGDVVETVPRFFGKNPETVIALAYFDLALYEPTKVCLATIKPHLVRGTVIMLDEFNSHNYPGETIAFKEVFKGTRYSARRSRFMNDRTFIIMD